MQQINKVKITENVSFTNFNDTIDTTGRINEKLTTKFNKKDIIKTNSNMAPTDNNVYSSLKTKELIENIDLSNYVKKEEEDTVYLINKENSLTTDGKININGLNQNIKYASNDVSNDDDIVISDIGYTDINYYKNKLYFVNYIYNTSTTDAALYILSISDNKLTYNIEQKINLTFGDVELNFIKLNVNNIYTFIYNDKLIIVYQDTSNKKSRIELIYDLTENISYTKKDPGNSENITFENSILYSFYIYNNKLFGLISETYTTFDLNIKLIDISYEKIGNNYYFSINKPNYDEEENNYGTLLPNYEFQDTKYNLCLINNFIYTINQTVLLIYQVDPSTEKLIQNYYTDEKTNRYCLTYNNDIVYCLTKEDNDICQLIMYDTKRFNPSESEEIGKTTIDLSNIPFDNLKKYVLYYSKDNYLYLYETNTTKLYSINLNNNEVITYDIYDEQKIKTSTFNDKTNYLFLENKQICICTTNASINLSLSPNSSNFYDNLNISSNSITIETNPTNKKDVVNKEYVDNSIDNIDSIKLTINDTPDEDFY